MATSDLLDAARRVLQDHEITDLEDGGVVYVDALALAALREATRATTERGAASARSVTLEVCSHCGAIADSSTHGHSDAPDWRWLQVEYVPATEQERETA